MTVKVRKLGGPKKPSAPPCPQFLMKSPINMIENVLHFEKIEISRFDSFFDRQKTVKKLSKQDISPKSKKYTKIFCKYGRLSSIFIGDFIKNWGQGVALGFFWPQSFHSLTVIFDKKKLANQKILFPKTQY